MRGRDLRRVHAARRPAERGADDDRRQAGRDIARQPDIGRPPTSTRVSDTNAIHGTSQDWKAGRIEMNAMEMPASVPSIAARGVYLRMVGPTNAPTRMMTPMMKHHARPGLPGADRVVGLQIDRQHDAEDDDEHVRHARPVRHGRHVGAVLAFGHLIGQVRVPQVAERQSDAERRQDASEDDAVGQFDDAEHEPGQHQDVQQDIREQAEKGVPVAGDPQRQVARCRQCSASVPPQDVRLD